MRVLSVLVMLSLIISSCFLKPTSLIADSRYDNQLILKSNSKVMTMNGSQIFAAQPIKIIKGISYANLDSIALPYGYKVSYDPDTQESVAAKAGKELRFAPGSNQIRTNGTEVLGYGAAYDLDGSLMIPVRMWANLTSSTLKVKGSEISLTWMNEIPVDKTDTTTAIHVSDNGRYLVKSDGTPFFWMGDTAWMMIQRLNRDEVLTYLTNAADAGFNVIQVVGLAQLNGLTTPNAHGDFPLLNMKPETPALTSGHNPLNKTEYDYWDHVDYVLDTAASLGIYIAFLPAWGQYLWSNSGQPADIIFNADNATIYGKWLGTRYKDQHNILWVLGGDRIPDSADKEKIVRNMASGIQSSGAAQLITYHPWGERSSSEWFQDESWLDFNMVQSGHISKDYPNYDFIQKDYAQKPVKPTFDSEPRYEVGSINFKVSNGFFNAYDVRQAAYWAVFSGAFGHTYGHESLWQIYKAGKTPEGGATIYWEAALKAQGRNQMKHLRALMESRPFLSRIPDQTLVQNTLKDGEHIRSTRGTNYAMIYTPRGAAFTVNMAKITGETITAHWYNPRTGMSTLVGDFLNEGEETFTPPSKGADQDWVLLLDDKSADFSYLG